MAGPDPLPDDVCELCGKPRQAGVMAQLVRWMDGKVMHIPCRGEYLDVLDRLGRFSQCRGGDNADGAAG